MFSHSLGVCQRCRHRTTLFYCRSVDEYLCEICIDQLEAEAEVLFDSDESDDGTNGQDRESYSDDQDRDSYSTD
jgi:hypothetical protein